MKWLVALLVVAGLLVAGDRLAEGAAERRISEELAGQLSSPPDVEIGGTSFLVQALGGRYDDIRVEGDVQAGDLPVERFTARLRGVDLPLSDALSGSVVDVPVDRVTGSVLVTYDVLRARARGLDLALEPAGDQLRISGSVRVLGQDLEASVLADVVVEGREVSTSATEVTVEGEPAPDRVADAVVEALTVSATVPELPYDLTLEDVRVEPDGLVVEASARDVVLAR